MQTKVVDIIDNHAWNWPQEWNNRFHAIHNIQVPILNSNRKDIIVWRDSNGVDHPFSIHIAWNSIREVSNKVDWFPIVSYCLVFICNS